MLRDRQTVSFSDRADGACSRGALRDTDAAAAPVQGESMSELLNHSSAIVDAWSAPGGPAPVPPKPPAAEPQPPKNPPPAQPQPTAPAPAAGAEKDEGVLWPSGNVRLLIWRSKHKKGDEFPGKEREDLPPAGKPFVARAPYHRLRVEVERDDVRKVELEWYVGEKKGAPIHVDDQDKDGRLRTEKNKAGKTCAILEFETPDEKPLILNLLLTTEKGEVLKEEFVVQRGKDKDDDGSKDGKDKGGKGGKKNK